MSCLLYIFVCKPFEDPLSMYSVLARSLVWPLPVKCTTVVPNLGIEDGGRTLASHTYQATGHIHLRILLCTRAAHTPNYIKLGVKKCGKRHPHSVWMNTPCASVDVVPSKSGAKEGWLCWHAPPSSKRGWCGVPISTPQGF